jgi:hypothetical protein
MIDISLGICSRIVAVITKVSDVVHVIWRDDTRPWLCNFAFRAVGEN